MLALAVFFALIAGCSDRFYRSVADLPRRAELTLPSGKTLKVDLALTPSEKVRGLSGIRDKDYDDDRGMLFVYWDYAPRRFWMPNTYFDLDIFFLNRNLKVLVAERDMPHYPKRNISSDIASTRVIRSAHVLEIKSASRLAKELKPGDTLKWSSKPPFETYQKLMGAAK